MAHNLLRVSLRRGSGKLAIVQTCVQVATSAFGKPRCGNVILANFRLGPFADFLNRTTFDPPSANEPVASASVKGVKGDLAR